MKSVDIGNSWKHEIALVLCYAIACILVDPQGEFPLNDGWAYAKSLFELHTNDCLVITEWQTIPMVPQMLVGYVLIVVNGAFSFFILRLSSILIVGVLIPVLYRKLNSLIDDKTTRFWICILLFFNPLVFQHSLMFMPDSVQMTLGLMAFLSFNKFYKTAEKAQFWWAIFWLIVATSVRQSSIVVGIAFIIVQLFSIKSVKEKLMQSGIVLGACVIPLIVLSNTNYLLDVEFESYNYQMGNVMSQVFSLDWNVYLLAMYYLFNAVIALGLFAIPLAISSFRSILPRTLFYIILLSLIVITIKTILTNNPLPFSGNVVNPEGLGPHIMTGAISYEKPMGLVGKVLWFLLNWISLTGLGLALIKLKKMIAGGIRQFVGNHYQLAFCVIILVIYTIPVSLSYFSDRYLIFIVPYALIIACILFETRSVKEVKTLIVVSAVIAVLLVSDYFSIQRTRWQALDYLTNDLKIDAKQIDGGFEFNAWYLFDFDKYLANTSDRWWWIEGDKYIVTTVKVNEYVTLKEFNESRFLGLIHNTVYILKRIE